MNLRLATLQRFAILVTVALALAYTLLLLPLVRRQREQEGPRGALRERLARASVEAGLERGTGFDVIAGRLAALRSAAEGFDAAVAEAQPRLAQPPEVRARLEHPFQLVEFLNESQRRLEELAALAQAAKVTLTPGLPRGFPRYQPEVAQPELLWVQLALITRVVRTAVRAGVREVKEISVNPLPLQEIAEYGPPPATAMATAAAPRRPDLRAHLTAVGSVDALGRLLYALALTPEELKAAGLPEDLAGRPALFIDQILLRRTQLEAAEEAQLEVVVSTVVPGEGA